MRKEVVVSWHRALHFIVPFHLHFEQIILLPCFIALTYRVFFLGSWWLRQVCQVSVPSEDNTWVWAPNTCTHMGCFQITCNFLTMASRLPCLNDLSRAEGEGRETEIWHHLYWLFLASSLKWWFASAVRSITRYLRISEMMCAYLAGYDHTGTARCSLKWM